MHVKNGSVEHIIPFVGASKSREKQNLKISLGITGRNVEFYIENSIPRGEVENGAGGMGLPNLRARLVLLYMERSAL